MKIEKLKHEIMRKLPVNATDAEKLILLAVERSYNDNSSLVNEFGNLVYEDIFIARSQGEGNYQCGVYRQGDRYDLAVDGIPYASGDLRYLKELVSDHLKYRMDDITLVNFEIKRREPSEKVR